MKNNLLVLVLAVFLLPGLAQAEGNFIVGTTNNGTFADLVVTGANSTTTKRSGVKATIDLSSLAQTSTSTTTTPVVALSQSAVTGPVLGVSCTNGFALGVASTCSCYTTTIGTKVGAIKILINGVARYIPFTNSPN